MVQLTETEPMQHKSDWKTIIINSAGQKLCMFGKMFDSMLAAKGESCLFCSTHMKTFISWRYSGISVVKEENSSVWLL